MSNETTVDTRKAPPFDSELAAALSVIGESVPPTLTPEMIGPMRAGLVNPPLADVIADRPIVHEERSVPGYEDMEIMVSIFRRSDQQTGGPGIYHIHGGGMIIGDRFTGAEVGIEWALRYDAVVVSVEYRLAPEFPDPVPVEDCYAGLRWMAENATSLGFDPARVVVAGGSAGGGLAAGVALLARDRGGPALFGQFLMCPMLDDRNETVSSHQYVGAGVWDRGSNLTGWGALLGDRRGTDAVSPYAAPARATDLSELPPAFIDVGSAEVFRDEDVDYATRIWAAGGVAELHVWAGGFHGFQGLAPASALAQEANAAQRNWMDRLLGHTEVERLA